MQRRREPTEIVQRLVQELVLILESSIAAKDKIQYHFFTTAGVARQTALSVRADLNQFYSYIYYTGTHLFIWTMKTKTRIFSCGMAISKTPYVAYTETVNVECSSPNFWQQATAAAQRT